jgi:uncharacterized protein (DUF2249 family)
MPDKLIDLPAIDVRLLPPQERHPRVFAMLDAMPPKSAMLLISDHDPVPLRRHLAQHFSGMFDWRPVEEGPEVWRAEIRRLAHPGCNCDAH